MSVEDPRHFEGALTGALLAHPLGPAFDVALDPGRPRRQAPQPPDAFEPVRRDLPYVQPIRHLPTVRTLALVRDAFGAAGEGLATRWAAAWAEAGVDVEALAGGAPGYEGAQEAAERTRAADLEDALSRLARWEPDEEAALALLRGDGDRVPRPVRGEAQHALEDAARSLEILRSPVDRAMLVSGPEGRPRLMRRVRGRWVARGLSARGAEALRAGLSAGNAFWATRAFAETSGRPTRTPDGMASLALTLLAMARAGEGAAFLKDGVPKGGTWVADLTTVRDVDGAIAAARQAMGARFFARLAPAGPRHGQKRAERRDPYGHGDWLRHAGCEDAFLVQPLTPFTHEHRFFVVDDRVVVSTPSARGLSLLDARPGPRRLDPRVARLAAPAGGAVGAYDRGASEAVEDRALVAAMARVVRRFCATFREERASSVLWEFGAEPPDAYVVDVGLTDAGVVAVIEVNGVRNAGLYAADPARVLAAMGARPWAGLTRATDLARLVAGMSDDAARTLLARAAGAVVGGGSWAASGDTGDGDAGPPGETGSGT